MTSFYTMSRIVVDRSIQTETFHRVYSGVQDCGFAVIKEILANKMFRNASTVARKFHQKRYASLTKIFPALVGYEMITTSLAIYHLISKARSWNNC